MPTAELPSSSPEAEGSVVWLNEKSATPIDSSMLMPYSQAG